MWKRNGGKSVSCILSCFCLVLVLTVASSDPELGSSRVVFQQTNYGDIEFGSDHVRLSAAPSSLVRPSTPLLLSCCSAFSKFVPAPFEDY